MKKQFTFLCLLVLLTAAASAQTWGNVLKRTNSKDSGTLSKIGNILKKNGAATNLSTEEIAAGLKQALEVGAERSTSVLSVTDGFFKNAALKILMPEDAKKVESTLRNVGLGKQVDAAILSMNRAAEDAAKTATPIFLQAIRNMTWSDAAGILKGGDFAATEFLKNKTAAPLMAAFQPIVEQSLRKVDATRYWNTVMTTYNRFSRTPVETDLNAYVTQKALAGIFYQLGLEEQKIRKNPAARTTELLKKVFGSPS